MRFHHAFRLASAATCAAVLILFPNFPIRAISVSAIKIDTFPRLVQPAGVIAQCDPATGSLKVDARTGKLVDPRGPITAKAKELGLSPQTVDRIRCFGPVSRATLVFLGTTSLRWGRRLRL